jgi:DNA-binding beta-propeller fold protein YncE
MPRLSSARTRSWPVLAVISVVGVGASMLPIATARAQPAAGERAPQFQVDPSWPKPLPNGWLMGEAAGVTVDAQDHVWVIQRPRTLTEDERRGTLNPPRSRCCAPAPPVLEFDADGNLLRAWGGPGRGYDWPTAEHGIFADYRGHLWIGGNGAEDHQVLRFTRDGTFLLQIGRAGVTGGDGDTAHLGRPAGVAVDPATDELFVADGYKNHRVVVFDAQTGAYKRHWGANGRPPGEPSVKSFGNPVHCVRLARDGLLYVCDRPNNRIQVFRRDGTFVKEFVVAPATRGGGSVWDVDVSHDASQTWLYNADGENNHVWTLLRESGRVLATFGRNGRQAGQFHRVHNLAVDSRGNIYTTEVDTGKRAQKFVVTGTVSPAQ